MEPESTFQKYKIPIIAAIVVAVVVVIIIIIVLAVVLTKDDSTADSTANPAANSAANSAADSAAKSQPKIQTDLCAYEWGDCTTGKSGKIAYIANGISVKSFTPGSSIDCNDTKFENILSGVPKSCYTSSDSDPYLNTFCADEGNKCTVGPGGDVMYRSKAGFIKSFDVDSKQKCTNNVMGGDPIPGRQKACYTGNPKL